MDHGHSFGPLFQGGCNSIQIEGHAPIESHGNGLAIPLADLSEALTELAIGYGDYLILMTDDPGYSSIHA